MTGTKNKQMARSHRRQSVTGGDDAQFKAITVSPQESVERWRSLRLAREVSATIGAA
jgi:hypothetical protein